MGRDLLTRHAVHWPWEPQDGEAVARAVREALGVLTDLRLVPVGEHGVRVLPAAHRYRAAVARRPAQLELA